MATTDKTTAKCVFIAIDIAKNKHGVLINYPNGKQMSFKIGNTREGYQQIIERARRFSDDCRLICVFEPTADYHRNITYWLSTMGCEMLYKSWDKNDRKDAQVISYLLEHDIHPPFYDPLHEKTMDAQEICNTYQQTGLARSRCWHSLLNH